MQHAMLCETALKSARLALVCGMAFASLSGCGKPVEPWGGVAGVVLQRGKPADPAVVIFTNREKGVEITAPTDANGRFVIKTDKFPGLPVGEYKVVVIPAPQNVPLPADGMTYREPLPPPPVSNIPEIYRDLKTTTLTATVQQGENDFKFDLQPPK